MGTDLVVTGDDSKFLALRMPQDEIITMIRESLGGETLGPQDLDRVKVPAGGGITWEIPTIDGTDSNKVIEGVIVHRATRRAYWPEKYDGSNEPPQCASNDGLVGQGEPGGPCAQCPFNEFGSGDNEIGKACKETRQLMILTPDSLIPILLAVPPASLANAKAYFLRLLRAQLTPLDVVTKITLIKDKSKGGIEFSKVEFAAGDRLDDAAKAQMREYAAALAPAFERVTVERSDIEPGPSDAADPDDDDGMAGMAAGVKK